MKLTGQLILLTVTVLHSFAQSVDSLESLLQLKEGKDRVDILHELTINTWLNYPDQAMVYAEEALLLSKSIRDTIKVSKSLRLIAGVYYYKGDYDSSLYYNFVALDQALVVNDSSLINNGYNNIGLLYFELGSYQPALEYLLRSESIKKQIGEIYGVATTLNNIGRIYDRIEQYDQARAYYDEAYQEALESDHQTEIYSLNNTGITFLKEQRLDTAMKIFKRALARAIEFENIVWGSISLRSIGEIFFQQGQLDSAKYYCTKSLEDCLEIDDKKGISESYYTLAKYYSVKGDYNQALAALKQSHKLAKHLKLRQQLLDNQQLFIQIHQELQDDEQTIAFQAEYISLRDSLFEDEVSRNLALVPIKLKEELDQRRLSDQESEIINKSMINRLYAVVLLISLPLVVVLIGLLSRNKKAHKELLSFNEELQQTQKLLVTSEKMASLGVMAAGIAHEINNPLNFIKNGVEALSTKMEEENGEQRKQLEPIFKIVKEGVDRATNIVKSLSHFSRKGPNMNEMCNIKEIIENCLLILHNRIKNKVRIHTDFASTYIMVKGNEGRLHQAMMNIIANAEQAIEDKGTISISTAKKDSFLEVTVEDNGIGIPEENLSKISDPFFTTKAPGEGTGLGLFITFSIIEEHNGKIDVISNPGRGTLFIVSLPLS